MNEIEVLIERLISAAQAWELAETGSREEHSDEQKTDAYKNNLLARFDAQAARIADLEAELATLREAMAEAILYCETCRGENDKDKRCARCKTFAALLWPQEMKS